LAAERYRPDGFVLPPREFMAPFETKRITYNWMAFSIFTEKQLMKIRKAGFGLCISVFCLYVL